VTGAINSARVQRCSPRAALDGKAFSSGYWQWEHLKLVDAVRQFGYPSLFITLSPYEYTFPYPEFLQTAFSGHGFTPTKISIVETLAISHILEQVVRGYITGCNDTRWTRQILGQNRGHGNIQTYFYRYVQIVSTLCKAIQYLSTTVRLSTSVHFGDSSYEFREKIDVLAMHYGQLPWNTPIPSLTVFLLTSHCLL